MIRRNTVESAATDAHVAYDGRYVYGRLNRLAKTVLEWHGWEHRLWRMAIIVVLSLLYLFSVTLPMDLGMQSLYAALVFGVALYLRRYTGTMFTLILIVISVNQSTRYLYWRFTETLNLDSWMDGEIGRAHV